MPTSPFFSNYENFNEQQLLHDLVNEAIKIHGVDMYYLPRRLKHLDAIYLEDSVSLFDTAYPIEIYVKDPYNFQGQLDLMSKFGLEIRDTVTFTIGKQTFDNDIVTNEDFTRPREGDLIYFTPNKKLFEIKFVENKPLLYQFGTLPMYDVSVELYEYSSEQFKTGISEIDDIQTKLSLNILDYGIRTETGYTLVTEQGKYLTHIKDIEEQIDSTNDNSNIQTISDDILNWSDIDPFSEGKI